MDERALAMKRLYDQGKTLKQVGEAFRLSKQRVGQIFDAHQFTTRKKTLVKFTPERFAQLKRAYRETKSIRAAAKAAHISPMTAFTWLHRSDTQINPVGRPVPKERLDRMVQRYRQCQNMSQVAREFRVSPTAVRRLFQRHNVAYRKNVRKGTA